MDEKKRVKEKQKEYKALIARRIRQSGIPLTQLAELSDLPIDTVRNVANENILPDLLVAYKISKSMGMTLAELLSGFSLG